MKSSYISILLFTYNFVCTSLLIYSNGLNHSSFADVYSLLLLLLSGHLSIMYLHFMLLKSLSSLLSIGLYLGLPHLLGLELVSIRLSSIQVLILLKLRWLQLLVVIYLKCYQVDGILIILENAQNHRNQLDFLVYCQQSNCRVSSGDQVQLQANYLLTSQPRKQQTQTNNCIKCSSNSRKNQQKPTNSARNCCRQPNKQMKFTT